MFDHFFPEEVIIFYFHRLWSLSMTILATSWTSAANQAHAQKLKCNQMTIFLRQRHKYYNMLLITTCDPATPIKAMLPHNFDSPKVVWQKQCWMYRLCWPCYSKWKRLIILYAGSEDGRIPNVHLMFQSKSEIHQLLYVLAIEWCGLFSFITFNCCIQQYNKTITIIITLSWVWSSISTIPSLSTHMNISVITTPLSLNAVSRMPVMKRHTLVWN